MSFDFVLPDLGEDVENSEVIIVSVLVVEGQRIEPEQTVVELETDKAVIEVPCPNAGLVSKLHVAKGDTVEVGQVLLTLETEEQADVEPPSSTATEVTATSLAATAVAEQSDGDSTDAQQDNWGPVRCEPISQIRRTIAQRMTQSASTIPHVTNFDDADVTELDAFRKNDFAEQNDSGIKPTLTPFVLKAVAAALPNHPSLNAEFQDGDSPGKDGQILYKQYVNLGVAVDTPRGLVVPVIRDADKLSIAEFAGRLSTLAQRARDAEFAVEELRGGSFTVSNLGAVGGCYSTPIINYPESAILLMGRARWMPVIHDGEIQPRLMLPLSLSYDHRLVDGAAAARFLIDVIEQLQSPATFRD